MILYKSPHPLKDLVRQTLITLCNGTTKLAQQQVRGLRRYTVYTLHTLPASFGGSGTTATVGAPGGQQSAIRLLARHIFGY